MKYCLFFVPFLILLLVACVPATTTSSLSISPNLFSTATYSPQENDPGREGKKVISLFLLEPTNQKGEGVDRVAVLRLLLRPTIYQTTRSESGNLESISSRLWENHNVTHMQICSSLNEPCQPHDQWIPFEEEQEFEIEVDWVGSRDFWIGAQFRDIFGNIILSVDSLSNNPDTVSQVYTTIVGSIDDTVSTEDLPPYTQSAIEATRKAFPANGSVEIESGNCCIGGIIGSTMQIRVSYDGRSPYGPVEEMRTWVGRHCLTENEFNEHEWQPFQDEKYYPVNVASGWVGINVSAQYRDINGNLSPVYCDDISVEGYIDQ